MKDKVKLIMLGVGFIGLWGGWNIIEYIMFNYKG
jgi:hypothetical protein